MAGFLASTDDPVQAFIHRWENSGAAERANYTMFLTELCDLLHVPGPEPSRPDERDNVYVFERSVPMDDGDGNVTIGRIDLYKRGCFVLEAKQGSSTDATPTQRSSSPTVPPASAATTPSSERRQGRKRREKTGRVRF